MSRSTRALTAAIAALTLAMPALAGIPVTPGNLQQKKCGASRFDSLAAMGTVVSGASHASLNVTDKRLNIEKPLNQGDVVFYVSLSESTSAKVYRTPKQIEIIDSSPLTPDVKITPDMTLPVAGTFNSKNGRKFDLVSVGGHNNRFMIMVDDVGFVCSERLDEQRLVAVGAPTAYQELPLEAQTVDTTSPRARVQSVAVTFMGLVGASAAFDVAVMSNGLVEARKTYSFDAFAPLVQIGDLSFAVKADSSRLSVTSLDEPTDYAHWLAFLRAALHR